MTRPENGPVLSEEQAVARWVGVKLAPLPEAAAHERARAAIRSMTPAEQLRTLVDAGIYTLDGELTAPYRAPFVRR